MREGQNYSLTHLVKFTLFQKFLNFPGLVSVFKYGACCFACVIPLAFGIFGRKRIGAFSDPCTHENYTLPRLDAIGCDVVLVSSRTYYYTIV